MSLILLLLVVLSLAYANGANDNFKGVATLFGSGTTNYRGALLWATVTTLLGSLTAVFLAGQLLKNFSGRGLVDSNARLGPGGSSPADAAAHRCSTDGTAATAFACGATVVHEPRRGYGSACLRGLSAIEELVQAGEPRPRIVVFLDADYSDHPDLLTNLIEPIHDGRADFVLGSRLLGEREPGAMPSQSLFGNRPPKDLPWFALLGLSWVYNHFGRMETWRTQQSPMTTLKISDTA